MLKAVRQLIKDVAYGIDAGNAIRHGLPPRPRRDQDTTPRDQLVQAVDVPLPRSAEPVPQSRTGPDRDVHNGLLVAYLDGRQTRWEAMLNGCVDRAGPDPRARLLAVFDALRQWSTSAAGLRSCVFARNQVELTSPDSQARLVAGQHGRALRSRVLELAEATGAPDPNLLTDQLLLLYEGTIASHATDTNGRVTATARGTARQLIATAVPRPMDPC